MLLNIRPLGSAIFRLNSYRQRQLLVKSIHVSTPAANEEKNIIGELISKNEELHERLLQTEKVIGEHKAMYEKVVGEHKAIYEKVAKELEQFTGLYLLELGLLNLGAVIDFFEWKLLKECGGQIDGKIRKQLESLQWKKPGWDWDHDDVENGMEMKPSGRSLRFAYYYGHNILGLKTEFKKLQMASCLSTEVSEDEFGAMVQEVMQSRHSIAHPHPDMTLWTLQLLEKQFDEQERNTIAAICSCAKVKVAFQQTFAMISPRNLSSLSA